jgi:very-short-patch-repair endonuclease
MEKHLPVPSYLLKNARELRVEMTLAEQRLWYFLRNRRFMLLKFRRQVPITPYIVDFFCQEKMLAIELDGSQHQLMTMADEIRTAHLQAQGINVLRFWNNAVMHDIEIVLEKIHLTLLNS